PPAQAAPLPETRDRGIKPATGIPNNPLKTKDDVPDPEGGDTTPRRKGLFRKALRLFGRFRLRH
ncbi:MAG: hypothetical protein OEU51_00710, partial [Gammaproteobacteria bacterium]|nr:hypothetical protein [Gammaproteobacteria bacterium]